MTDELHSLIGAYVLDALPAEEVEAFREHLLRCDTCRAEEAELRAAAARLGERVAARPSPQLRSRVLAAADRTPQLPPLVPPRPTARGVRRLWRPGLLVAAAAALAAVGVGVVVGVGDQGDSPSLASSVVQVFEAADAHETVVEAVSAGELRVAVSRDLGAIAIDTSGLEPVPDGKDYQLWFVADGDPASAGLVGDLATGERLSLPDAGVLVAITIEPRGGSEQPTTAPVAVFDPGDLLDG